MPLCFYAHHAPSCLDITLHRSFTGNESGVALRRKVHPPPGREFPIADEANWAQNLRHRIEEMKYSLWLMERNSKLNQIAVLKMDLLMKEHPDLSMEQKTQWIEQHIEALVWYGVNLGSAPAENFV